jgi:hypothetical protein
LVKPCLLFICPKMRWKEIRIDGGQARLNLLSEP